MTLATLSHFQTSGESEVLREILHPGINLCIWERQKDPAWSPAIHAILHHHCSLALDLAAPTGSQIADFMVCRINPDASTFESITKLAADITDLAAQFGEIANIRHPRIQLTRVEDDGCALFHADTLTLRLLCTYAGPGTQWLENDNVRRDELGARGRSLEEATEAIVIDPFAIRTLPPSHVAIFTGRLATGEEGNALVHRSSPVRHPDDFRLRLCIDLPETCTC